MHPCALDKICLSIGRDRRVRYYYRLDRDPTARVIGAHSTITYHRIYLEESEGWVLWEDSEPEEAAAAAAANGSSNK